MICVDLLDQNYFPLFQQMGICRHFRAGGKQYIGLTWYAYYLMIVGRRAILRDLNRSKKYPTALEAQRRRETAFGQISGSDAVVQLQSQAVGDLQQCKEWSRFQ